MALAAAAAAAAAEEEGIAGPNAASQLAMLPEELLTNISVKLQSDDVFALRQTCRDIETKCLHEFAKEYFQEKCFMFSSESLRVLVNIANSPKLRGYLHHAYFITALVKERPKHCVHHCLGHCWHPTVRQQEAFTIYLRDQQHLRKTRGAKNLIKEALSKLPRLRGLSLVDSTQDVPLSAEVRGLAKFMRTTSTTPHYAPSEAAAVPALTEYFEWLSYCWKSLLMAVAESGNASLKSVETKMRSHLHGISPVDDLKFRPETFDKLKIAFANLKTFCVQFRSYAMRKGRSDGGNTMLRARQCLADFVPLLSNVTIFRWSFDLADHNGVLCRVLANALDLSKLKKIQFDSIAIDSKTLGTIIAGLRSVEVLKLHGLDLTSGSWVTILRAIQQLPKLEHLHLEYLQQLRQKVYFLKQLDESDLDMDAAWGPIPDDMSEDVWSESDGTDEPPELISQDELDATTSGHENMPTERETTTDPSPAKKRCARYGEDYKEEGQEHMPERGYFICLPSRHEIQKQLPVFIEECNVGLDVDDGLAGLGGLNGLLAAALGGPIGGPNGGIVLPMGPPPPPQAGVPAPPQAQATNTMPQTAPGGQGGNIAINALMNQFLTGGPPHGHHHTFTASMPALVPLPPPSNVLPPNIQPMAQTSSAAENTTDAAPTTAATSSGSVGEPDDGEGAEQWMDGDSC